GLENSRAHEADLDQAVAQDAAGYQGCQQNIRIVGKHEKAQRKQAAHDGAHQAQAVALPRQGEAGLHDDNDGQDHPVAVQLERRSEVLDVGLEVSRLYRGNDEKPADCRRWAKPRFRSPGRGRNGVQAQGMWDLPITDGAKSLYSRGSTSWVSAPGCVWAAMR